MKPVSLIFPTARKKRPGKRADIAMLTTNDAAAASASAPALRGVLSRCNMLRHCMVGRTMIQHLPAHLIIERNDRKIRDENASLDATGEDRG
jgi:hypothetical protein